MFSAGLRRMRTRTGANDEPLPVRPYVGPQHLTLEATIARRLFYDALADLAARYAFVASPAFDHRDLSGTTLAGSELKLFSQNGEDGVIAELLRRVGVDTRFFVEIGVGTGSECNCAALADVLGWTGVFVEGDERLFAALERKYRQHPGVTTVCSMVTPDNASDLLTGSGVPAELDVLAIDVDGRDYWLWRALSAFRPRIVVIEYNAALGETEALTVPADHANPWDGTQFFGASIAAYEQLAAARGYRLVHTDLTGANAFFVREDLAGSCPDRSRVIVHGPNYLLSGLSHAPPRDELRFVAPPAPD